MAAALSDQQLAAIEAQLSSNPAILQALQADRKKLQGRQLYTRGPNAQLGSLQTGAGGPAALLRQYGIEFPDAEDYQIQVDPSGQVKLKRSNWFQRNADWVVPIATIGTAGIASAATGGAAPALTADTFVGPAVGGPAAATTGGTLAGLGAREWIGIGGMGADALGRWYAQRQADKAAGREIDMSREALELEQKMFEQEQAHQREVEAEDKRRNDRDFNERQRVGERDYADLGPYRNIGTGALSRLAFGVGIPDPNSGGARQTANPAAGPAPAPTPVQPWTPDASPMQGGTLSSLGNPAAANVSQGGMTTMRTPTGQTVLVPSAKVQEAIAQGGTVLQGAA